MARRCAAFAADPRPHGQIRRKAGISPDQEPRNGAVWMLLSECLVSFQIRKSVMIKIATTGQSHSFARTYLELKPHARVRYSDKFDARRKCGNAWRCGCRPLTLSTGPAISPGKLGAVTAEVCSSPRKLDASKRSSKNPLQLGYRPTGENTKLIAGSGWYARNNPSGGNGGEIFSRFRGR